MKEKTREGFALFGRTEYSEPLTFVARLEVSRQELEEKARSLTSEKKWVELVALPEEAIIAVVEGER